MTKPKAYEERLGLFLAQAAHWDTATIHHPGKPWTECAPGETPAWTGRVLTIENGHSAACECCGNKRLKHLYPVIPDGNVSHVKWIGCECWANLVRQGRLKEFSDYIVEIGVKEQKGELAAMIAPEPQTFDPAPFDPATAPIEMVWVWLCGRVPGLRESPGLGIPPNDKAGPLTYCEGRLYGLLRQALGIMPVWCSAYAPETTPDGECHVIVDIYAGYGFQAVSGDGEARCAWGDSTRYPAKEARLRAAADLMLKKEKETP